MWYNCLRNEYSIPLGLLNTCSHKFSARIMCPPSAVSNLRNLLHVIMHGSHILVAVINKINLTTVTNKGVHDLLWGKHKFSHSSSQNTTSVLFSTCEYNIFIHTVWRWIMKSDTIFPGSWLLFNFTFFVWPTSHPSCVLPRWQLPAF